MTLVRCKCGRPATRRVEPPSGGVVYCVCDECAWIYLDRPGWRDADIEDELEDRKAR